MPAGMTGGWENSVRAIVVHESPWGNTAQVARAIAELIVAGAPTFGFKPSSDQMREPIRANPGNAPSPPDHSHPALRARLAPPDATRRSPRRRRGE
jgi:hypothetical protein